MINVSPIEPVAIMAWQISETTAPDVMEALAVAASVGYTGKVTSHIEPNSSVLVWQITLSRTGYADAMGGTGDWMVYDGTAFAIYSNPDFVDRFTTDIPLMWDASLSAASQPGGASLSFPAPTSPNGPFTYTVLATDSQGSTVNAILGGPSEGNGRVALTVGGLTAGFIYTFTVTVHTRYGFEATSAPSNAVTCF